MRTTILPRQAEKTTFRPTSRRITAEQLAAAVADCPADKLALDLPPYCNTGVETHKGGSQGSKAVLVDYLRFVIKERDLLDFYLDFFGGSRENWTEKDRGYYGYTKSHRLSNISIYSEGGGENGDAMGFCVQISGLGCREFEASFVDRTKSTPFAWSWQHFLSCLVRYSDGDGKLPGTINVTRLDVALDDRCGSLNMDLVKSSTLEGHFSCRGGDSVTESPCKVQDSRKRGSDRRGVTVEFGRKSSTQMVRIYDKAAEMASKGGEVVGDWIRTEYQANGERAHLLAQLIAVDGMTCVPGIIQGYLDFKDPSHGYDASHKCLAPTAEWWSSFLEAWQKITITLRPHVQTVEGIRQWVEWQVVTNLAILCDVSGRGLRSLEDLVSGGRDRYKPRHLKIIERERARLAVFEITGPTGF